MLKHGRGERRLKLYKIRSSAGELVRGTSKLGLAIRNRSVRPSVWLSRQSHFTFITGLPRCSFRQTTASKVQAGSLLFYYHCASLRIGIHT